MSALSHDLIHLWTCLEFYEMEPWMVKKAIHALAREGKAEFIPGSNPDDSDAGVKFFS